MMPVCRQAQAASAVTGQKHGFSPRRNLAQALLSSRLMKQLAITMLSAFALLAATPAFAQLTVGISNVTSSERNDDADAIEPFNSIECGDAGSVMVELAVSGTSQSTLYIWVGRGTANCATQDARSTDDGADCFDAGTTSLSDNVATVTLADLDVMDELDVCDNTVIDGKDFNLYVFDVEPEASSNVPAANTGNTSFTSDVTAPQTPVLQSSSPISGSQKISVDLDNSDAIDTDKYRVYVDQNASCFPTAPSDAGAVDLNTLGAPASSDDDNVSVDTGDFGLNDVDDSATAYATVVDEAGNESDPSAAFCLLRVNTSGFCDDSEGGGTGEKCGGCSLAVVSRGSSASSVWFMSSMVIGFAVLLRRRRG